MNSARNDSMLSTMRAELKRAFHCACSLVLKYFVLSIGLIYSNKCFASDVVVSSSEPISGFPPHNYLTIAMIVFGALALILYSRAFHRFSGGRQNSNDEQSQRDSETNFNQGISVIVVIVATVVMGSIGYEKEIFQYSMTLFGTIIGFLLGRATKG